jgi:hypothetical protein
MKKIACIIGFVFLLTVMSAAADLLSIADKTGGMEKLPGYFPIYWDNAAGKLWLEVDKFDSEFLYVHSLSAGLGSNRIGLDRSQLGGTRLVKFQRIGPKVLLIQPNYDFRADGGSPAEKKAVRDAFGQSVVWGFQAAAETGGRVLVDATDFLLRDAHQVISSLERSGQSRYRIDSARSAVYMPNTKNFLENTEMETLLTFISDNPSRLVFRVAPDPGAVTLRQHHSFIRLPEPGFELRKYDPRSNFSAFSYMDFMNPVGKGLTQRYIRRHRLEKVDPSADISDPVEPIIYYIDPGCPEPIRTALKEGGAWWNQAFEAIGYRNAFQVKILPEDADPMDIRYNMVNWIPRSSRGWSYGASVTDPRTGEIIKGHVALGALRIRQDYLIAEGLTADYQGDQEISQAAMEMSLARVRQLSAHEIGHTLGLGHNYAASINDRASVMDYPHPTIRLDENGQIDLSDAYAVGIGEWDTVSIAYGYQDFPDDADEEAELREILNDAFRGGLYFLAGQDAGGAHPLAAVWDNGRHPVDELEQVMTVRTRALETFSESRVPEGEPLGTLEERLVPVFLYHRYQVDAAASLLGGLYYNHRLRGDVQENPRIVTGREQRRALEALLNTLSPEELTLDERVVQVLHPRPPGYRGTAEVFAGNTGLPFDPVGAAAAAARITVDAICHPERAARLAEYHARSPEVPGWGEVLNGLLDATLKAVPRKGLEAEVQQTVNFVVLNTLMRMAAERQTPDRVKAMVWMKLDDLHSWLEQRRDSISGEEWKAHYLYAAATLERFNANPETFQIDPPPEVPQGAPIGGWSK